MKSWMTVKNRREGEIIRRALEDPTTRALVLTTGALLALPTDRARERVIRFVVDKLDEQHAGQL